MTERDRTHGQTGDELDTMPGPGLRSDQAGASGSLAGPAPKGGDPEAPHPTETRWDPDVPAGDATGTGGGFGTGSDRSSAGTGEGQYPAGGDPETDWLREAPGGPTDRSGGSS